MPLRTCSIALLVGLSASLSACARPAESPTPAAVAADVQEAAARVPNAGPAHSPVPSPMPVMTVHKSASCGCCGLWVEHMREAGFTVEVRETDNLEPVKTRLGVPYGKGSCHTAEVGGYFVEGHVPADDVRRLLAEKPEAKGLVLPGMPIGSPGMEAPDGTVQPYTVELVTRDGSTRAYAEHGPKR